MYSELLDKNSYNAMFVIEAVLDNLCLDAKEELKKIFKTDYLRKTFEKLIDTDIYVIRLKENNEPVGLFGLVEQTKESAGIYLLTAENLKKGNITTFLRNAKNQVDEWMKTHKLIMDSCYKENKTVIKWLENLGFKKSEYQDDNFQIYYRGDINEYS